MGNVRLQELISTLNLTPSSFAKKLGYDRADKISFVLNGRTKKISKSLLSDIKRVFPRVNTNWLVAGSGLMFFGEGSEKKPAEEVHLPTEIADRFQSLLDHLGENTNSFASSLNERAEKFYSILRGDTKRMNSKTIAKIKEVYPNANTDWLNTGNGYMFLKKNQTLSMEQEGRLPYQNVRPLSNESANTMMIPIVTEGVSAGYLNGYTQTLSVRDMETYPTNKIHNGVFCAFTIDGDSMETEFSEGDTLVCKNLSKELWNQPIRKTVFIVEHNTMGFVCKMIAEHDLENKRVLLYSFNNQEYDPYWVSLDNVRSLWYYQKHETKSKFGRFSVDPDVVKGM